MVAISVSTMVPGDARRDYSLPAIWPSWWRFSPHTAPCTGHRAPHTVHPAPCIPRTIHQRRGPPLRGSPHVHQYLPEPRKRPRRQGGGHFLATAGEPRNLIIR